MYRPSDPSRHPGEKLHQDFTQMCGKFVDGLEKNLCSQFLETPICWCHKFGSTNGYPTKSWRSICGKHANEMIPGPRKIVRMNSKSGIWLQRQKRYPTIGQLEMVSMKYGKKIRIHRDFLGKFPVSGAIFHHTLWWGPVLLFDRVATRPARDPPHNPPSKNHHVPYLSDGHKLSFKHWASIRCSTSNIPNIPTLPQSICRHI